MIPEVSFTDVLRRHARFVVSSQEVDLDAAFGDLGIDSMESIALLLDTEDTFGVVFPEELLTPETFSTPRALFTALQSLVAEA